MPYTVRPARAEDQAAVERIVREAYAPWIPVIGTTPGPMEADYGRLIADGHVHVVDAAAPAEADPAGLIVLVPEGDALFVDNVAVDPAAQGQGIGSTLLAFAEHEARRLGLPAVRLHTHAKMESNVQLYKRIGYQETGTEAVEHGHLVRMRKQLGDLL